MSHTICGRMDSAGNCPTPDLLFIYSLVTGVHVNLAARMAKFFIHSAGRTTSSEIHGGKYVTQLAYNLGIMKDDVVSGLTMVHAGGDVDMRSLRAMGLVVDTNNGPRLRGLNGEIWDLLPLLPQNEDVNMAEIEPPPHD
ncbi:hypothetical protein HanRHA438_Chr13g0589821 [Helianthus annuus]|nr:hypothetical protein HanRHA438_Chr13g0589821 [Helianthus annuus]